jgi:uncharacterized membrane protein YhdT
VLCAQSVLFWATLVLICRHAAHTAYLPPCANNKEKQGYFFSLSSSILQDLLINFISPIVIIIYFDSPLPFPISESFETTNHFLFRITIRILSVWCFIAVFPPTRKGSLTALRVGERGVQLKIFNRARHALNQIFLV